MDLISSSDWVIIISALTFGFVSSLHCVSMCGPLICQTGKGGLNNILVYQVGRLISYLVLGFSLHLLSNTFLSAISTSLQEYSFILLTIIYLIMGVSVLLKKPLKFENKYFAKWYRKFFSLSIKSKSSSKTSLSLGLISALLPCGLLHSFLIGVITIEKPLISFLYIFSFWLSTSPALMGVALSFSKLKNVFKFNSPLPLGLFYLFMGGYLYYVRYNVIISPADCH